MRDGLNRKKRFQRLDAIDRFVPVENSIDTLLRRAEEITGFIRYYNLNNEPDGTFDQFIGEIKKIRDGVKPEDGEMEPSQALLYTFAHQLSSVVRAFNDRWREEFMPWYLNEILGVLPKPMVEDYAWVQLGGCKDRHTIPAGTGFTCSKAVAEQRVYYRMPYYACVSPVEIIRIVALHLDKNPDIYPANIFGMPVALHMRELSRETSADVSMFSVSKSQDTVKTMGLHVTSPSLLLREGKRWVSMRFVPEKMPNKFGLIRKIVQLIKKEAGNGLTCKATKEDVFIKLFSSIFHLKISIQTGWESITGYTVRYDNRSLTLEFILDESFPSVTGCDEEHHGEFSEFPALKIHLNHDAWLYPYPWLRNMIVRKIVINTNVEGIANISFYNELGQVDTSKPFAPFGINTEQGAWFVVGNYEMAIKHTNFISLKIDWHQLPKNDGGLYEYYRDYEQDINARSFRLRTGCLKDYKWEQTGNPDEFFLFSTEGNQKDGTPEAEGRLAPSTKIKDIYIESPVPVFMSEQEYEYTIRSKNGYLNFVLEEPDMGFGEKSYRQLYTKMLMSKAFRKNGELTINPPLNPIVDRITLSYRSSDVIDLRTCPKTERTRLSHIYPLGKRQVYPRHDNQPVPFVYNVDSDSSILFGLNNVVGEEHLNLYLSFYPLKEEVSLFMLPELIWYWGDGYSWQRLPDDSILMNTTRNFVTDGVVSIYIPKIPADIFKDKDGVLWLRVCVVKNEHCVATISRIYTNVVKVVRDQKYADTDLIKEFVIDQSETKLPGVRDILQVTPFNSNRYVEDIKAKCLRVSEFVTHRDRAVTLKDYERMALEAFSAIRKVKCMYDHDSGNVLLAIIPQYIEGCDYQRPYALPKLLLDVEDYFNKRTSRCLNAVDAVHPIYEEIMVRCEVVLNWTKYSQAGSRALLSMIINRMIAPWQTKHNAPSFGYAFTVKELSERIRRLNQVVEIKRISVVQMIQQPCGDYKLKEYTSENDIVTPSCPHAIFVPASKHLFMASKNRIGLDEMVINENFVIWQNEIEKP